MRRARPGTGLLAVLLILLTLSLPASAAEPFAYRWEVPAVRLTITWREGTGSPATPALRRQAAHWKRLIAGTWKGVARPLDVEMSLLGPDAGSEGPLIRLRTGDRSESVGPTLSDAALAAALTRLGGGSGIAPDDTAPRIAPNGRWLAFVSWRAGMPEVWVTGRPVPGDRPKGTRDVRSPVLRVAGPATAAITDALVDALPEWSPDGRLLAWSQGGRLHLLDIEKRRVRVVTPAEPRITDLQWAPGNRLLLLARCENESWALLDVVRGRIIAAADLLPRAAALGEFFWSPGGTRLLFRAQTRIVAADLGGASSFPGRLERLTNRLAGARAPTDRLGPEEERLVLLDIAARRVESFPVRGTPLEGAGIHSAAWTANEETLLAAVAAPDAPPLLLARVPLRAGLPAFPVLTAPEPLAVVGAGAQGIVIRSGARVLSIPTDSTAAAEPAPVPQGRVLQLRPGPDGGYRGMEEDTLTHDEEGLLLVLAPIAAGESRRFPGGILAPDSALPDLEQKTSTWVDVDLHTGAEPWVAAVRSPDGGPGELLAVSPGAPPLSLSEAVNPQVPVVIHPVVQVYRLADALTGLQALSGPTSRYSPVTSALGFLGFLGLMAMVLAARRRLAARR